MSNSRKLGIYFLVLTLLLLLIGGSLFLILGGTDFGISAERVEVIYVQG